MAVEERRRIALHRAAADTWGEEVADTLVELVAPSGHELATRADIDQVLAAMDARFAATDARIAAMDERWDARIVAMEERWDTRLATMEERWDARFVALEERWDARAAESEARMDSMEHRLTATFERRIAEAVSMQTRTLVWSQLGALVVIAALAFGLR